MQASPSLARFSAAVLVVTHSALFCPTSHPATMSKAPECVVSTSVASIDPWLARTAWRLAHRQPVTIVAIGSSSTAGAGASSPAASYPARLEALLKRRFPATWIRVLNRRINGEKASNMVARLEPRDVLIETPGLMLWQVGTNAILRDSAVAAEAPIIRARVRLLMASGADVILMDSQFAPQVIAKREAESMVELIAAVAHDQGAGAFHRFALMRAWHEAQSPVT
jgi:acyl-CoA thioesterase I